MSGLEVSLFEQLTAEHHAFAFLLVLDLFSDETRPSTSAIFGQNKKSTRQTKLHFKTKIIDKCIARFKEIPHGGTTKGR